MKKIQYPKVPENLRLPEGFWTPKMGRVPYHFQDKPAGSRCLWTCRWLVAFESDPKSRYPSKSAHLVEMNEWHAAGWELGMLDDETIRCELEDVGARPNEFAPRAVDLLLNSYPDKAYWRYRAEELLFQTRPGYPEVVAPWREPDILHNRTVRPGWESWPGARRARVIGAFR